MSAILESHTYYNYFSVLNYESTFPKNNFPDE
jgi:hypothetical protein